MNFKENKSLLIINIISLLIFILLAILVCYHKTESFDNNIYEFFSVFISPPLTNLALIISEIGNTTCIVMICLMIIIIPKTRWVIGIPASITVSISAILNSILKNIFRRPRPDILRLVQETSFSFPSGHSMNNMALYSFIALSLLLYFKDKAIKYSICLAFFLYVLLVGLSRIYLGVHYASDVLAGFAMGIWVSTTCFIYKSRYSKQI